MKISFRILLLFFLITPAYSQTYKIDTLQWSGTVDSRINIVVLGDGYTASELEDFYDQSYSAMSYFFTQEPFKSYKNYFNVFCIRTPSNVTGAALSPSKLIDNFYGSTYGYQGIDRLLCPTKSWVVLSVLENNFPDYDQVIMIVNSTKLGGGGGWLAVSSEYSVRNVILHEVGHSFVSLGDEYWSGEQFMWERINTTQNSDPKTIIWKNWVGVRTVGIFSYGKTGALAEWFKPTISACRMQVSSLDFCPVCCEAIVKKIHTLTSPLDSSYLIRN